MNELTPLSEHKKEPLLSVYRKAYTHDWVFHSIIEKLIIIVCVSWSAYSLVKFIITLM